jgi:hypothetical protein
VLIFILPADALAERKRRGHTVYAAHGLSSLR